MIAADRSENPGECAGVTVWREVKGVVEFFPDISNPGERVYPAIRVKVSATSSCQHSGKASWRTGRRSWNYSGEVAERVYAGLL
ncbi:MAG: hypothetical protein RQM90_06455 [Methanoculleus sp.]